MKYDYLNALKEDIRLYIGQNYSDVEMAQGVLNLDEWKEKLNDDLWIEDSVTGNGSGSYTFSTYQAEEYICHNLDLLSEALEAFGCDVNVLEKGAEYCDVTIRCYLLGQAITEVLDELRKGEQL